MHDDLNDLDELIISLHDCRGLAPVDRVFIGTMLRQIDRYTPEQDRRIRKLYQQHSRSESTGRKRS